MIKGEHTNNIIISFRYEVEGKRFDGSTSSIYLAVFFFHIRLQMFLVGGQGRKRLSLDYKVHKVVVQH